jgi:hypothetical protein
VTAVGSGLLGQGLEQAGLQGQQLLCVLHAQTAWAVPAASVRAALEAVTFSSTSFSHAFERLGGQAKQGFDVGFVGCQDLFSGQHGNISSKVKVRMVNICAEPGTTVYVAVQHGIEV